MPIRSLTTNGSRWVVTTSRLAFLGVCAFFAFSKPAIGATAPVEVNVQGRITNAAGDPVTASLNVDVCVLNHATNGNPSAADPEVKYRESHTGVQVTNGQYSIAVGAGTPTAGSLSNAIRDNTALWVTMNVQGDGWMTPRIQIRSSPYSLSTKFLTGTGFAEDGTAANPAYTFASDQDTGLFRQGADTLGLSAGGTERIRLNSSGNFGIGTGAADPAARLSLVASGAAQLNGSVRSSTLLSNAGALGGTAGDELVLGSIGFSSGNNTFLGLRARRQGNGADWTTSAIGLGMDVDNTRRPGGEGIWITAGGTVGVGTAAPLGRLDVSGPVARGGTHATTPTFYVTGTLTPGTAGPAANNIEFRHDNGTQGIGFGYQTIYATGSNPNQVLNIQSRGTSALTLNGTPAYSTGAVAIGTTAPVTGSVLDITGDGKSLLLPRKSTAGDPIAGDSANGMIYYNSSTQKFRGRQNGQWVNVIGSGSSDQPWSFMGLANSTIANVVGSQFTGVTLNDPAKEYMIVFWGSAVEFTWPNPPNFLITQYMKDWWDGGADDSAQLKTFINIRDGATNYTFDNNQAWVIYIPRGCTWDAGSTMITARTYNPGDIPTFSNWLLAYVRGDGGVYYSDITNARDCAVAVFSR